MTSASGSIQICLDRQCLVFQNQRGPSKTYPVSTAVNGSGSLSGSNCTPLGRHSIRLKIGTDCPAGTVFVGRRATNESYSESLAARHPERDWILSRILWLQGRESGRNRGPGIDTLRRFIYIHGTPDEASIGQPKSHGCIRMRNQDVIELFDVVSVGCSVHIHERWTQTN